MSKKTLFILLFLPFVLAISFFAVSNFLVTKVKGDISNIEWEYKSTEAHSLVEGEVELVAKPILANKQFDADATLTWTVKNVEEGEPTHARIEQREGKSYLVLDSKGSVVVTCTNSSGNVSKSFTVKIYDGVFVTVNARRQPSQTSIEGVHYYGEYDLDGATTVPASFFLDVQALPASVLDRMQVETSKNVSYDAQTGEVKILGEGEAYVRYKSDDEAYVESEEYKFSVVKDGVNVYTYSDLLECTNRSQNGRIVCLQSSFESLSGTFVDYENGDFTKKNENTELFGTYDKEKERFDFANEVYTFESTYNTEYIDQYNAKNDDEVSKDIVVGLRIQKDFYGNGYLVNLHNLTYPTKRLATEEYLVTLGDDDLFRGPLPYVIIGTNDLPVVKAFGQDNVGFLIDGDGITLRDVNFKNCDYSSTLENNDYTGTVVEIMGDDVTIVNSHLSSGKNVLRSFSNKNTLVKNTLLEKGREFIAKVGANEYEKIDMTKRVRFTFRGVDYDYGAEEFFDGTDKDKWNLMRMSSCIIKSIFVPVSKEDAEMPMEDRLELARILSDILGDVNLVKDGDAPIVKNEITFEDCMFYQSGIFSIGIDTLFNGPYMYNGSPVQAILAFLDSQGGVTPHNIAGTNYATRVNLVGDTNFFDYKTIDQVNLGCLIDMTNFNETINMLLLGMAGVESEPLTIDDFFPVKTIIANIAEERGLYYTEDGKDYFATPYVMYGGGKNLSFVDVSALNGRENLIQNVKLDTYAEVLAQSALEDGSTPFYKRSVNVLKRCVSLALGFEPFDIMTYKEGYLFGENASLSVLRTRAGK